MYRLLPKSSLSRQIGRLNLIAGTPQTAFKFGPNVKKIELILLEKNIMGPNIGLKKFWRYNLPTLKFHNDEVEFFCTRVRATTKDEIAIAPAKVIIHDSSNTKIELDCKSLDNETILENIVLATRALPVAEADIPQISHSR